MKFLILLTVLFFSFHQNIHAAQYDYNKLRFTDYEEFRAIKSAALKASRKFDYEKDPHAAQAPLKEVLKMLFSRPNDDNMIRTMTDDIESDLKMMRMFEITLQEILKECEHTIFDTSLAKPLRATGILCMNNAMTEMKPQMLENTKIARAICEIADKKIKLPKDILNDSALRSMMTHTSPSKVAQTIMHWYAAQKNKAVSQKSDGCPFSKRAT